MRVIPCEQGTPEWAAARAGNVTASRLAEVMAKGRTKGTESVTRRSYLAQIVAEILSGKPCDDGFESKYTRNGTELEPLARAAYEMRSDVMVDQVGFVLHPFIARYGASPDGLVGTDGMIEIKCGKPSTHLDWLLTGKAPAEHRQQMFGGMDCCERQWCDFVSYCPVFPEPNDLFVVRFYRDDDRIADVRTAVVQFLSEVNDILEKLPKAAAVTA